MGPLSGLLRRWKLPATTRDPRADVPGAAFRVVPELWERQRWPLTWAVAAHGAHEICWALVQAAAVLTPDPWGLASVTSYSKAVMLRTRPGSGSCHITLTCTHTAHTRTTPAPCSLPCTLVPPCLTPDLASGVLSDAGGKHLSQGPLPGQASGFPPGHGTPRGSGLQSTTGPVGAGVSGGPGAGSEHTWEGEIPRRCRGQGD